MENHLTQIAIFFIGVTSTSMFTYGLTLHFHRKREKHLIRAMIENNKLQKEIAKIQSRVIDQQDNITMQVSATLDTMARATSNVFDIMKELKHEYNRGKTE